MGYLRIRGASWGRRTKLRDLKVVIWAMIWERSGAFWLESWVEPRPF